MRRFDAAREALRARRWGAAREWCVRVVRDNPSAVAVWRVLALAAMNDGDDEAAIAAFRRTVTLEPADFESHANLNVLWTRRGEFDLAIDSARRAMALRPGVAELHYNLGNTFEAAGRWAEAGAEFAAAVARKPAFAAAHSNLGSMQKRLGDLAASRASFAAAVELAPDFASARRNLGIACSDVCDWTAAIEHLGAAVALAPAHADGRAALAAALVEAGQYQAGLDQYRITMEVAGESAALWFNVGCALLRADQLAQAVDAYERALVLDPTDVLAHVNAGTALLRLKRTADAIEHLERALALDPSAPYAVSELLAARRTTADWQAWSEQLAQLRACALGAEPSVHPLSLFAVNDEPQVHRQCARTYASWLSRRYQARCLASRPAVGERLRVAYVSPDFADHPVGQSIVEVLERHDRSRIELIGVSLATATRSPLERRIRMACERYIEADEMSNAALADLIRAGGVDVAVDLCGNTARGRPLVFADRPAPVQVSYLGYPGTLGAPWMDYLICDGTVVPTGDEALYDEAIVRLPGSFFPSDTRVPAGATPAREALGLPPQSLVLACLTKVERVLPDVYATWMGVLRTLPQVVLWLSQAAPEVRERLRAEAVRQGVSADRICFATRVEAREDYFARIRAADLCVDTFPYNGHSTVRDALWAGVPVVTRRGQSFPSRVAASLIGAAGLAELVCAGEPEYTERIVALLSTPDRLAEVTRRARSAPQSTLFDIAGLTHGLEAAYEFMVARARRGEPARGFDVRPGGAMGVPACSDARLIRAGVAS